MSLTALLLLKVLSDLPRGYAAAVATLTPLSALGYAASPPAYNVSPWLGLLLAMAAATLTVGVVVAILTGYEKR